MNQPQLFDHPKAARPSQKQRVLAALDRITGSADTLDIQRVLADYFGELMDRNIISKRLQDLEAAGLVERTGRNLDRKGSPTTWRRR